MATTTPIQPGDQCRNGAVVLLASVASRDGEQVILADARPMAGHPFVTWRAWRTENGSIECAWGEYLQGPVEAAESFVQRVRESPWGG